MRIHKGWALGGVVLVGMLGACGGASETGSASAPTVTVTVTETVTAEPEPEPEPVAADWSPTPADFSATVKVLEQKCFGSAGCNVTFRIEPTYNGDLSELPDEGSTEVTYKIVGAEDTLINTFILRGDQVHYDDEERAQVASSDDELTVEITDVQYNP